MTNGVGSCLWKIPSLKLLFSLACGLTIGMSAVAYERSHSPQPSQSSILGRCIRNNKTVCCEHFVGMALLECHDSNAVVLLIIAMDIFTLHDCSGTATCVFCVHIMNFILQLLWPFFCFFTNPCSSSPYLSFLKYPLQLFLKRKE